MKTYNPNITENTTILAFDICNEMLKTATLPIFMCVGTSKVVADCIGPLVGHLLTEKYNISTFVYGNLKNNITLDNVNFYYDFIKNTHKNSKIYVIDSALGELENVGLVKFNKGAIYLGGHFTQNNPLVGHYNLLGVINTTGVNSLLFLKNTKLNTCLKMAHYIAASINYAFMLYNKLKTAEQVMPVVVKHYK